MMTKSGFANNDEPPFYSVDRLAKFGDTTQVFYAVGIPRNEDYTPYKLDNVNGLVALYKIEMARLETSLSVQTNDICGPIQVIMIDMTLLHQPSYFAEMQAIYQTSAMIGAYFTVSNTLADLNKIGTTKQAIMWVPFPLITCSASPTVSNGVSQPIQLAKISGNANNADYTTQLVMNIEKYGSRCTTFSNLYCEGVVINQKNPDESQHVFMVTTT